MATVRSLELRLLRCTLPPPSNHHSTPSPPPIPPHPLHPILNNLIELIECGNYNKALSSDAVTAVFNLNSQPLDFTSDSAESAHLFYTELLPELVNSFITNGSDNDDSIDKCYRGLIVMSIAVSSLLAFTQSNITGPLKKFSAMPLMTLIYEEEEKRGGNNTWVEWEGWALKELMSAGSDLCGKFSNLQYLVFAKILLMRVKDLLSEGNISSIDGLKSISWWLARVLLFQQRLLDDRSSSLFDLLQVYIHECLDHFGTVEKLTSYWSSELLDEDASTIVSMLHLEAGIIELTYARVDSSGQHFELAALSSKLDFSVSGALGFRTVHQVEPKAQLRLVSRTNKGDKSINSEGAFNEHTPETREASDVLMAPRFVENETNSQIQLKPIQQLVLLAQCFSIEKSARSDELEVSKMAPYIEAIDAQKSSHYIIKYICDILRIRWESTRSRTKQRALLMMNNLVEGINETLPVITQRIYCCFSVNVPTISALRREYGDLLVSCGLIGEAVKVYEDLELWDNLIHCYRLMEKKAASVDLIKMRLSENPSDPRLWCSLGDVTNDDTCYKKALEVSGNRSARAQRSLARSAYNRGDYEKSQVLWERAMALNSLYPDGWFALGAAALKARNVDKALDGFTRAVQLDPENGEAWNNIACLHMVKKKNKESFIAFKEALKYKRNSWQMWENFSHVAADVGNLSQALEAVQKVIDMTKNKRFDTELLDRISIEIEEGRGESDVRETEHLFHLLGKILRQIVQSGGSGEAWGLYARWHKVNGDLTMCSEALLKQVRSYQGSDLYREKERFVKFANASLELCKVYQELSSKSGTRKELFAAEMHLKSTIKQGIDFSDTEEYKELAACLDEVQKALQPATASDVSV